MSSIMKAIVGAGALAFAVGTMSSPSVAQNKFAGLDLAPDKVGGIDDMEDISKYCGTKPLKVAYSDGWGANYWRQITRREFEEEAKKCSNITEVRYTDGKGSDGWPSAEKQIADIQGLIAQKFDVIVVFADTGEAVLKALKQAHDAGIAVVPFTTGDHPFGKMGEDYVVRATETQIGLGKMLAEWVAKQLGGKGNVIVHGGTEGNPMTTSQAVGWKEVFAKYPDIKVLEGPVTTNWDPAFAQQVMADAIAKYPQIDAVMAETTGPIQAFLAAGKPIPIFAGQDLNVLSCLWQDNHEKNPTFKLATASAHTWLVRLALRKGLAAANGMNNTEPSLINLPFSEDSTSSDPKLAVKCDKSLPATAIPSAMLSGEAQKEALGTN
jgi:ribose transport system substrate-binding protein